MHAKSSKIFSFQIVPTPDVSISVPNNLTTGQPLTMDCTMIAVRGITSRVDIVWYGSGGQFRSANNVTATIINSTTALYRDSFNISSLTRQHDGSFYSCRAIIYSEPSLFIYTSIRLNVTCKFAIKYICDPLRENQSSLHLVVFKEISF